MDPLNFRKVQEKYPPSESEPLRGEIAETLRKNRIRLVVLDDDPTGIQTVHGNYLLTNWRPENLSAAFSDDVPFFYLLTNTRAMTAAGAETTIREAVNAVLEANKAFRYRLVFISRSDSTLRGHFPLEPETMKREIERHGFHVTLPVLFIPAFFEAGRYTVDGIHYMKEGDSLIPVAETEFARDNVFGYTRSDLNGYIVEKSGGRVTSDRIGRIPLAELRNGPLRPIERIIAEECGSSYLTVDAFDYTDLRRFSLAFLNTLLRDNDSITVLRTSSSLPKALSGISDQALLDRAALNPAGGSGLFMVGSHVKKSTSQLGVLLGADGVEGLEVDVDRILHAPDELLRQVEERLSDLHNQGITPVVYTSRREIRSDDSEERQHIGQRISAFLVEIIRGLNFQPAYLVGKGGITSHEILTKGLGIERARVLGQVLPGVPVVRTGARERFSDIPYIIFPGNVGDEGALKEVYMKLR